MNSDLKAQLRELNITAAKVQWGPSRGASGHVQLSGRPGDSGVERVTGSARRVTASAGPDRGGRRLGPQRARASPLSLPQEIEVGGGRKAIIIFVPVPQLKSFQKIQVRLVRELEKKFSGKHVVFIAQVAVRLLHAPSRESR